MTLFAGCDIWLDFSTKIQRRLSQGWSCQGKRMKIFSRFNKGHGVSQARNALRLYRKIICTEPL
jgi:hypothetical protein